MRGTRTAGPESLLILRRTRPPGQTPAVSPRLQSRSPAEDRAEIIDSQLSLMGCTTPAEPLDSTSFWRRLSPGRTSSANKDITGTARNS